MVIKIKSDVNAGTSIATISDVIYKKGYSPYIGTNGNWYEYDESLKAYKDSGVRAKGDGALTPDDKEEIAELVEDEIGPEISQLKEDLADDRVAIDNRIKKFFTSNNGDKVLNDSDDGMLRNVKVFGKCEQTSTTGKNLLDCSGLTEKTVNGVKFTPIYDDGKLLYINANGTSTALVSFCVSKALNITSNCILSGCASGGNYSTTFFLQFTDNNTYSFNDQGNGISIPSGNNNGKAYITVRSGVTINNLKFYPMIRLASIADNNYEPYTGGIPSPNPIYPQEIKAVKNPKMEVCGKNIAKSYYSTPSSNPYYHCLFVDFDLEIGKEYTISFVGANGHKVYSNDKICTEFIATTCNGNRQSFTFVCKDVPENQHTSNGWGLMRNASDNTVVPNFKDVQIENGNAATDYEQYKSKSATLPFTLNAIPVSNTSDGNVTIDGQRYLADYVDVEAKRIIRRIGEYTFTTLSGVVSASDGNYVDVVSGGALSNANVNTILSEKTITCSFNGRYDASVVGSVRCYTQQSNVVLKDNEEKNVVYNGSTILNGSKLIYALATPTSESLTDEQLADFLALRSYYPATNVKVTSDELDGLARFLYPVSLESGWEYIKEQLGDTREFVYNQADISDQAFINAQYAEILAELALD